MSARALPSVDPGRCTGCGRCVAACPPKVLSLQTPHPMGWGPKAATLHDAPACTGCAQCFAVCPFDAIRMARQTLGTD